MPPPYAHRPVRALARFDQFNNNVQLPPKVLHVVAEDDQIAHLAKKERASERASGSVGRVGSVGRGPVLGTYGSRGVELTLDRQDGVFDATERLGLVVADVLVQCDTLANERIVKRVARVRVRAGRRIASSSSTPTCRYVIAPSDLKLISLYSL